MCSILIFVKPDNVHPDPSLDWQKFKAGDVIDVMDADDFYWGDDIQGPNPLGWWKVVTLPNVSSVDVKYLLDGAVLPLVSIAPEDPTTYPHAIRLKFVDVSLLNDVMTLEEFLSTVRVKPPFVNYNAIG